MYIELNLEREANYVSNTICPLGTKTLSLL